ncbi:MAG: hypothetical protein SOI26_04650 [Coriobacteriales bacterium]|jgi:hypothetical protein
MSSAAALPTTPAAAALAEAAGGSVAGDADAQPRAASVSAPRRSGARGGVAVRRTRTAIDAVMVVLLLLQMGRQLMPSAVHEACGIALGALAVAHVVLNRRWFRGLARGRWDAARALRTVIDAACIAILLAMVASGLGASGLLRDVVPAVGRPSMYRGAHMTFVYLALIVFSLHLGTHWKVIVARVRSARGDGRGRDRAMDADARAAAGVRGAARRDARGNLPLAARVAAGVAVAALCAVGAYELVNLRLIPYITHAVRFAFIDTSTPLVPYLAQYASVMVLFATLGRCLDGLLTRFARRRRRA